MPDREEKIETASVALVVVLKDQVREIKEEWKERWISFDRRLETILEFVRNGLNSRILILEQIVKGNEHVEARLLVLEQKVQGFEALKKWIAALLLMIIGAMAIGFVTNNQLMREKNQRQEQQLLQLQQQLTHLEQRMGKPPFP